ncbi:hypothetical protein HDC94_001616 [Leifsonia sp. AK011]|uniref:class F sortase n=1 Tax=Leifsonia sp. AK011 TaxID=2723075 RepID=UPI0015CCD8F7|nr:class F sortase [Leifsonia sp. AK011]NYF10460.1 hypothetical protein [Leifsonia sp. AK011]
MTQRSTFAPVALLLLAGSLALAGCTPEPVSVEPRAIPTPSATAEAPAIGTHSAALAPVREPVPPVRVQVEGVGIDVSVVPVGVQPDGYMELPPDVAIAGWYRFGSDPGSESGTTVISAHVDSLEYGLGPFSQLKTLGVGAPITVTSSDGTTTTYAVESVQSILKDQLPLDQVFDREGSPRLVLITCGGQFNSEQLNYSDNVVVVAVPQ